MTTDNIKSGAEPPTQSKPAAIMYAVFFVFLRFVIAPLIRLIWVGRVEGLANIPEEGPAIIASNHESYLDFMCLWAVCPRPIYYLAGEKMFRGFWRPFMLATGQIRVDRQSKDKSAALSEALKALKGGKLFGIFPEGTRTRNGEMGRAYTGVAKIALAARAPVVPAGLIGAFEILPPHKRIPRLKKCDIVVGSPVTYEKYYSSEYSDDSYRLLTDELMTKIGEMIGKTYPAA